MLHAAFSTTLPSFVAATIQWSRLLQKIQKIPHLFADHVSIPPSGITTQNAEAVGTVNVGAVTTKTMPEVQQDMRSLVMEAVKDLLGSNVAHHQPLMEAGLDSLGK